MCISWNFLPLASTSISTGVKKPGIADDASSTSRNSLIAASSPFCAIAPMSQITRRPASTLVVTTRAGGPSCARRRRRRRARASRASRSGGAAARCRGSSQASGRSSKMSAPVIVVMALRSSSSNFGAEEGVGREQRADAHAGDDAEVGPLAGLRPAGEQAGGERAVGAAARHREPRAVGRRQHLLEIGGGVAPDPHVRKSGNDRGGLDPRRCKVSAAADLSAPSSGGLARPAWSWPWPSCFASGAYAAPVESDVTTGSGSHARRTRSSGRGRDWRRRDSRAGLRSDRCA